MIDLEAPSAFENLRAGLLLELAASGDQRAVGELYDAIGREIFAYFSAIPLDPRHVEELTLKTFLDIWIHAPRFPQSGKSGMSWINQLVKQNVLASPSRTFRHTSVEKLLDIA